VVLWILVGSDNFIRYIYVAWSFAETFEDAEISLLFRQGNPLVTKCRWEELPFSFG